MLSEEQYLHQMMAIGHGREEALQFARPAPTTKALDAAAAAMSVQAFAGQA